MGAVPLAAAAEYVGHSTIQMTMRYAHLMPGANAAANSVVDAFYESEKRLESGISTDTSTSGSFSQPNKPL